MTNLEMIINYMNKLDNAQDKDLFAHCLCGGLSIHVSHEIMKGICENSLIYILTGKAK